MFYPLHVTKNGAKITGFCCLKKNQTSSIFSVKENTFSDKTKQTSQYTQTKDEYTTSIRSAISPLGHENEA